MGTIKKIKLLVTDFIRNCQKIFTRLATATRTQVSSLSGVKSRHMSASTETDAEFDARWEAYFKRDDIDDWELRHGLNKLYGEDLVPEPKIINAALHACRRLNDFPTTVRLFEMIKDKSGGDMEIYNYIIQQCKPTIDELGLSTPEQLGF